MNSLKKSINVHVVNVHVVTSHSIMYLVVFNSSTSESWKIRSLGPKLEPLTLWISADLLLSKDKISDSVIFTMVSVPAVEIIAIFGLESQ